jgi:hypothetical protein
MVNLVYLLPDFKERIPKHGLVFVEPFPPRKSFLPRDAIVYVHFHGIQVQPNPLFRLVSSPSHIPICHIPRSSSLSRPSPPLPL